MVIGGNAWVIGGDMMGLLTTSSGLNNPITSLPISQMLLPMTTSQQHHLQRRCRQ
jgi:hypothetical protein